MEAARSNPAINARQRSQGRWLMEGVLRVACCVFSETEAAVGEIGAGVRSSSTAAGSVAICAWEFFHDSLFMDAVAVEDDRTPASFATLVSARCAGRTGADP